MPSAVPLDSFTGAAFIGLVVSLVIYGITCLQAYLYFTDHASGDRKPLKTFVAVLMCLDTLHVAMITHILYWYTITNFGDYKALHNVVWTLDYQPLVADLLSCLVQGFFAWRIYMLSQRVNWWIPMIIVLSSLGFLSCTIGFGVATAHIGRFATSQNNVPWLISALSFEIISDTTIMAGMLFYLYQNKSGFTRTRSLVNTLILYTLNTGFLTTLFTVLTLAIFLTYHDGTLLYIPFFFVLARIYACSFLSTLNTRKYLRQHSLGASTGPQSPALSDLPGAPQSDVHTSGHISFARPTHVHVGSFQSDDKTAESYV